MHRISLSLSDSSSLYSYSTSTPFHGQPGRCTFQDLYLGTPGTFPAIPYQVNQLSASFAGDHYVDPLSLQCQEVESDSGCYGTFQEDQAPEGEEKETKRGLCGIFFPSPNIDNGSRKNIVVATKQTILSILMLLLFICASVFLYFACDTSIQKLGR